MLRRRLLGTAAPALILLVVLVAVALSRGGNPRTAVRGLPDTRDHHALLVSRTDPRQVLLGTHGGLYETEDGGRTWTFAGLPAQDAMNLVRTSDGTTWAAGHEVLARSRDGGRTWAPVSPQGLPGLDIHAFAADPRNAKRIVAAIAGAALFHSDDGGQTFGVLSDAVGGGVNALALDAGGRIFAGDVERGLLASDDSGRNWRRLLFERVVGIAINPRDSKRVLAGGDAIFLSTDGGATWERVLAFSDTGGPVAWSPSRTRLAYAIGDGKLYRSDDAGASWRPVS